MKQESGFTLTEWLLEVRKKQAHSTELLFWLQLSHSLLIALIALAIGIVGTSQPPSRFALSVAAAALGTAIFAAVKAAMVYRRMRG